jgi:S-adenosylmethionine hydrolase
MSRKIVIITDCSDVAYNELRGILFRSLEEGGVKEEVDIEPVVTVSPFSIINGSFVLRLMAEAYPSGTIFLVILNPMKDRPKRIFGKTHKGNLIFMGANTGVFSWFLKDFGIAELYELNDPGFLPFGGKYVHAPNIAKLIAGVPFKKLGTPFDTKKLANLSLDKGTIVNIDNFGLIKFIGELLEVEEGERFKISISGKEFIAKYGKRMMSYETGEWIIYPGSSLGLPELGKVRDNGAQEIGANVGDKITFKKI